MIVMIKVIKGCPNYSITDSGQVWSHISNKWLKPFVSNGYSRVHLGLGNKKSIHRLVLETFVGPCPENMECCHNNGDKSDNRVENLRWDTKSNNSKDDIRHGIHTGLVYKGEKHYRSKLTNKDIMKIRRLSKKGYKQKYIAKLFGICRGHVSQIILRKRWKHIKAED